MATTSRLERPPPPPPPRGGGNLEHTTLFSSLTCSTPARSVQMSHNPSVHVYHALKMTIEHSTAGWLREFLELDGLGSLVEAIEQLSSTRFTGFSDAILLLDCIACVRAVLNTNLGMTYFLNSDIYMRKLVKGLATGSTLSKKHVFELLTAVCIYSNLGYRKTVDGLQHYQKCTDQTSMFSVIVDELKFSDTALYRTSLMSLLNTLLNCTEQLRARCAMRNQLIALKLLDMMHHFRRDEKDADLAIQLEAFSVAKHRDDLELAQNYKVNPANHQDIFYFTYQEVLGKPESADFLNILQDLYLMTTSNHHKTHLWKATAQAVHHLSSLSTRKEADTFINLLAEMTKPQHNIQQDMETGHVLKDSNNANNNGRVPCRLDRKDSGISDMDSNSYYDNSGHSRSSSFHRQGSGRTSGSGSLRGSGRPMMRIAEDDVAKVVNLRPTTKTLTRLKWIKVPRSKVKKELSLWGQGTDYRLRPNITGLEVEFPDSHHTGRFHDADDEVELLTGAQSVALNVYLARMDMSPEELVGYVEDGDDVRIGLSGLRYLLNVLPAHEEIMQLRGFKGERYDLGQAEQFLLLLSDLPDYRTLLSCLVFKAEFGPRYQKLKTAFTAMIKASRDILHHQGLKDFLFLVLDSGNHLNQGSVYGAAAGMRLCTLSRLTEVRGRTPGTTLLDHLVRVADAQSDEVTMFAADIPQLAIAASHDLEELKTEVTQLSTEMRKVLSQLATTHPSVKSTFDFFIEDVKQDLQQLQDAITQTRSLSQQMALYFCEDEADFRLHTALRQINQLCEAVKKSTKEGIYARQQTTRAEKRQDEIKEQRALGKEIGGTNNVQYGIPQTDKIVDYLLKEVHSGHIMASLGEELKTPDLEWDPLHFSHIAPASPILEEQSPDELLSLEDLLEEDLLGHPCLPDRVDNLIGQQYRKTNQVASSSFISPDNGPKRKSPLASPEKFIDDDDDEAVEIQVKEPKPQPPPKPPQPSQRSITAKERVNRKLLEPVKASPTHRRTASDINNSQVIEKKWIHYEKQKENAVKSKALAESGMPTASLGLEKNGQAMSKEDILDMSASDEKENAVPQGKVKKKRSSFGLFKKISRALKPKNSDNSPKFSDSKDTAKPKEQQSKKAVRPNALALNCGKENFPHYYRADRAKMTQPSVALPNQDRTAVETVEEEPLYKIVIYQKYQSSC